MKYPPIIAKPREDQEGHISLREDGHVTLQGWRVQMGGRVGGAREHQDEVILAVLKAVTEKVHENIQDKTLLLSVDEQGPPISLQIELDAEREAGVWLEWCKANS